MEIRKINDTTIRCIITQQDMKDHQIDLDDFIEHKPQAMQYLHNILREAAEQEHFNADGPFTTMQIRVLQDQSICLTLTQGQVPDLLGVLRAMAAKLSEVRETGGEDSPDEGPVAAISSSDTETDSASGRKGAASAGIVHSFVYDRMDDVIDGCRHVPDLARQDSSLYYLPEERAYYLMVFPRSDEAEYERALLSMNEFGDYMELEAAEAIYIREHGICILKERAAERLRSV